MRRLGLLLACAFVLSAAPGCEPSSPGGTQPATPESNAGVAPAPPTPPAEPTGAAPAAPTGTSAGAPATPTGTSAGVPGAPTGTSAIAPGEPHPHTSGSSAPATTPPVNRPCIDIRAALVRCPEGDALTHEGCDGPEYMKRCLPKAAQKK